MKRISAWWQSENLRGLWLVTVLVLIGAVAAALPLAPHDLWMHIRLGQQMVANRALILTDIFSFTQYGQPYFNNAWLGEIILYALWQWGGAPLLVLARAVGVVIFYALFGVLAYRASRHEAVSALLILLAAIASFPHWQLRPQTFALPLFAFIVWLLVDFLDHRAPRLYALTIAMMLWVNLHGSFVLGLLLIGLFFAGVLIERIVSPDTKNFFSHGELLRLGVWSAASFGAVLVNPLGLGILETVNDISRDPSIQGWVLEWLPPNPREFPASVFFLLVAFLLVGLGFLRQRSHTVPLLWSITFVWLGWFSYRNVLWASVLMAFTLAPMVSAWLSELRMPTNRWTALLFQPQRFIVLRMIVIFLLIALTLISIPQVRFALGVTDLQLWVSSDTPVAAVDYMRAHHLTGRTFHEIGAGSYMLWALWSQQQVFVDSRINLYPPEVWRDYFAVTNGLDEFAEILDKYHIDYLLIDSFWQAPLLRAIEKRPDQWRLLYHSGESYLFERVINY
jgi:hypothetical protein